MPLLLAAFSSEDQLYSSVHETDPCSGSVSPRHLLTEHLFIWKLMAFPWKKILLRIDSRTTKGTTWWFSMYACDGLNGDIRIVKWPVNKSTLSIALSMSSYTTADVSQTTITSTENNKDTIHVWSMLQSRVE